MIRIRNILFKDVTSLYSWGSSWSGQLGLGKSISEQYIPKKIDLDCDSSDRLFTGGYHCLLVKDKSIYSWGQNKFGQLGNTNSNVELWLPTLNQYFEKNLSIKKILKVACGNFHSIVNYQDVNGDTMVVGFGWNDRNQLGFSSDGKDGVYLPREIKEFKNKEITSISGGFDFTIISTKKDGVYSFGMNDKGQCGLDSLDNPIVKTPTKIPGLENISLDKISSGWGHSIGLTSSGKDLFVWGSNFHGQCGLSIKTPINQYIKPQKLVKLPVQLGTNSKIMDISCASSATLILIDNKMYICGSSGDGKLGIEGQKDDLLEFTNIPLESDIQNIKLVSMGKDHGLAVPNNNNIFIGWGFGQHGSIGVGNLNDSLKVYSKPIKNSFFSDKKEIKQILSVHSSLDTSYALVKEEI